MTAETDRKTISTLMKIALGSNNPDEFLGAMAEISDRPLPERMHYNDRLEREIEKASNIGDRTRFYGLLSEQGFYKGFFRDNEIPEGYPFSCDTFAQFLAR